MGAAPVSAPDLGMGSHAPILARAFLACSGPVVECGTGHWSTWMLHEMCAQVGRSLLSVDTDKEWLSKFSELEGESHRFERVSDWLSWAKEAGQVSLVFVDCAPGEIRVPLIKALADKANLIVAHDTEADEPGAGGNYGWRELKGYFRYESTYSRVRPWTTLYSNFIKLPL